MLNVDGRAGSKATAKEICEIHADAMLFALSYLLEVTEERMPFYLELLLINAHQAAHYGRKSLHQK